MAYGLQHIQKENVSSYDKTFSHEFHEPEVDTRQVFMFFYSLVFQSFAKLGKIDVSLSA